LFSKNGHFLAFITQSHLIALNMTDKDCPYITAFTAPSYERFLQIQLHTSSDDKPTLIACNTNREIAILDLINNCVLSMLQGYSAPLFSLNNTHLIAAHKNGHLIYWDLETLNISATMELSENITKMTQSPNGMRIATIHSNATFTLWDATTAQKIKSYSYIASEWIFLFRFVDDILIMINEIGHPSLKLWNTETDQFFSFDLQSNFTDISSSAGKIFVGYPDGAIDVLDPNTCIIHKVDTLERAPHAPARLTSICAHFEELSILI
jgi:WD40 repeat protein